MNETGPSGNERHIYGPPGCGKTSKITRDAVAACKEHGDEKVLVISFTRAAKATFDFDDTEHAPTVSTLHSICWHALGKPTIAEGKIDEFNSMYPKYKLGRNVNPGIDYKVDDDLISQYPGDRLYAQREYLLATCTPGDEWTEKVVEFDKAWSRFKTANRMLDFSDLIEETQLEFDRFPGEPTVVFIDEAQDLSRAEIRLIRHLSGHDRTDQYVFALDDDQTIYGFKGSSPEDLVPGVPDHHKQFLTQSHRIPSLIQKKAERWISRLSFRQDKVYMPRETEGKVLRCQATIREPEAMLKSLEDYLSDGKTVMIIVSCGYMLRNIIALLARQGIPFHNPYRKNRFDWNPLDLPGGRISDADRIRALLYPVRDDEDGMWSLSQLRLFLNELNAGVFRKDVEVGALPEEIRSRVDWTRDSINGNQLLEHIPPGTEVSVEVLRSILQEGHLQGLLSQNRLQWFHSNLMPSRARRPTMKLALNICRRHGLAGLETNPKVIVGTIHSVKGGEADVVYLFPDLSTAGLESWWSGRERRDPVVRLMYVGITRARETLVICEPYNPKYSVDGL